MSSKQNKGDNDKTAGSAPNSPQENASEAPWYQVSFEDLAEGFSSGLEPHWMAGEWPEWVANAMREILKTIMPIAQLGNELKPSPRVIGGVLGHQIAAWNEMVGVVENSDSVQQKAMAAVLIPGAGFPKDYAELLSAYGEKLTDAMKRVCGRAIEAEYHECVAFFEAFTRGMKTAPSTTQRTNTGILLLLAVLWRKVEGFDSIRELHDWLCQVMNPRTVGNLKRIEKLCQRIGYRVRGKGRPPGNVKGRKFRQANG